MVIEAYKTGLACLKLVCFLMVLILLIPLQLLAILLKCDAFRLPLAFHKIMMAILGVRLKVIGSPSLALYASNHISWLDILVYGSITPMRFFAKSEVAGWPLFGLLAKLQNTLFVNRNNLSDIPKIRKEITQSIREVPLMLFAEGTTSNGETVLPFLASFIVAPVQPVVICYKKAQEIAWIGEMTLAPHLWQVFKIRSIEVHVEFLDPILAGDRKAINKACEQNVRERYLQIKNAFPF